MKVYVLTQVDGTEVSDLTTEVFLNIDSATVAFKQLVKTQVESQADHDYDSASDIVEGRLYVEAKVMEAVKNKFKYTYDESEGFISLDECEVE